MLHGSTISSTWAVTSAAIRRHDWTIAWQSLNDDFFTANEVRSSFFSINENENENKTITKQKR